MTKVRTQQEERSPYLPAERTRLREYLVRCRYRLVYHVWMRAIRRYERSRRDKGGPLHILDVGCGPGNFLCSLEHWFGDADLRGLDVDASLLEYAAGRVRHAKLVEADGQRLPVGDRSLDVLSALQVVEHLERPESLIDEGRRVLKPGGLFLIATPNPRGLAARILADRWQGYRDDHISLRPPEQWGQVLRDGGFTVLSEGTTLLNGLPVIGRFPLGLPLQVLQAFFGWFPWTWGESYMVVAGRPEGG